MRFGEQTMVQSCPRLAVSGSYFPCIFRLTGRIHSYHSIRIDAVHYCDREADLAAKRKRRSSSARNSERDPPQERLQLFTQTVRASNALAHKVQFLKMPYMTRESSTADLARAISALPSLIYVDLPDGFYSDDASAHVLKQELQSRCPDIRKMKYFAGAEDSFTALAEANYWQHLEVLELYHLHLEVSNLAYGLASLAALQELELIGLPFLDDSAFSTCPIGTLPPVTKLKIKEAPDLSIEGLSSHLSRPTIGQALTSLTLIATNILPDTIDQILALTPRMSILHLEASVSRPCSILPKPPLVSRGLKKLHFEVSALNFSSQTSNSPMESYYTYLANSIMQGDLPSLTHLYGLSNNLPSLLLQGPKTKFATAASGKTPQAPSSGLKRKLQVFTKTVDEQEWELTVITPPRGSNRRGSATATRPMSLYGVAPLSPQWRDKGRESAMVGNGFGGYLIVPGEVARTPRSAGFKKERDAWMG